MEVKLRERAFGFEVNGGSWKSKLGGTNTIYFLLAYNYALLRLSNLQDRHYPGITLLDFPPQTGNGEKIGNKENFMMDPFVGLLEEAKYGNCQVIATGVRYEGLAGVNHIHLRKVWK